MKTIITEFGKFRYNRIPLYMCESRDKFQAKLDKIIGYIKCFNIYINNILVLRKVDYPKYIA